MATILAMSHSATFDIIFDKVAETHFDAIDHKDHSLIFDAIEEQLTHEPNVKTHNRKPMRIPNRIGATWELRCGANNRYRVFYDFDVNEHLVVVLAVGRKSGNLLWIGKERIEL